MRLGGLLAGVLGVWLLTAGQVEAIPLPLPADLNPGDSYHLIFVTSTTTDSNFGGLAGGDAYVQARANSAGIGDAIGVSWLALLSQEVPGTVDAISRFNPTAPVYNMNGERIANNGTDLWDGLLAATPEYDESGASVGAEFVWTGTNPDGTLDTVANGWVGSGGNPTRGTANSLTDWIRSGNSPGSTSLHLYGVSEQITFAPEPSTGALVLIAIAAFAYRTRDRERLPV